MRYRKLSADGDMTFGAQQANFYRDQAEGVAQAVVTRLGLWLQEWFLDTADGTPYQTAVLGKFTAQTIEPAIRQRILQTDNVTGIESFELIFDPDERHVTINATINTIYGVTTVRGVL